MTVKRKRRTKAEMRELRDGILQLAATYQPCTVRQIYYLGIGRLWDKDSGGSRKHYADVVRLTGLMREEGELRWGWIADNTRWIRQDTMYASTAQPPRMRGPRPTLAAPSKPRLRST